MILIGLLALMVGGLRVTGRSGLSGAGSARPHVPAAGAPVAKTVVVHVRPVDDQGRLRNGFMVTETVDGAKCYADGSAKVAVAQRCVAGEYIYDPCWTETGGPSGPSVVCMSEPWTQMVQRLLTETYTAPEPPVPDFDGPPWSVELVDGQRCRIATGAHDSLNPSSGDDADVVDYYCGEELGLVLLRGIDKIHPVWTARAARYVKGHYDGIEPKFIAAAWF